MSCLPLLCGGKSDNRSEVYDDTDEIPEIHNVHLFSYRELKAATDNFSLMNKLGEGGYGPVYKGKLRNGQMAAIKILSSQSKQGVKEFLTEIQAISDIDHENLVKLYGCCVEESHRILVYQYLENNSLSRTLFSDHGSIHFSWPMRVKICIGVARGLAFLHEEVNPHIIHRDIKASNILLDKDFNPKISDFGFAKLIPPDMSHISTRVAGTVGYLAPEYAVQGRVTRRADTYSFGVLLAEIVSGRKNTIKGLSRDEQYLLEKAWQLYQRDELVSLVDAMLNNEYDVEQACMFFKVALLCTQDNATLRPSMPKVVRMLTEAKHVNESRITAPGLITELTGMKKDNPDDLPENETVTSTQCSQATMTFTTICDR